MNPSLRSQSRGRTRQWLAIVAIALGVHLFLLLSVRESFFDFFRNSPVDSPDAASSTAPSPQAIVAVLISIDGEEPQIVNLKESSNQERAPSDTKGLSDTELEAIDLQNIVGAAQSTLPAQSSRPNESVLPRPVEITWPRTESLGHCLGMRIRIKIEVGAKGQVISVRSPPGGHPGDCLEAALDAARRIKFLPGRVAGEPVRMWTEVRIDFLRTRR